MSNKVVVCQFYSDNVAYGKLSEEINRKYCQDNGYEYFVEKDTNKLINSLEGRSWTWYKPKLITEVLETYSDCEYVLFLDIDAVITNHKKRIEDFTDTKANIVMTEDYGPSIVNAGVILVKNNDFIKNFLKDWWDICEEYPEYKTGLWHDQTCLKFMYNRLDDKELFKIIKPHDLNSRTFNLKSFIFHAFSYGHLPLRSIDQVHNYIFNGPIIEGGQTLSDISKKYPTDKDFEHNYYNLVYEKYFNPLKDSAKKICEIGIGGFSKELGWEPGNSLKVWRDYFKNAEILGLDIVKHDLTDNERITLDYIDQSNLEMVKEYSSKINEYDIILDDGSHNVYDQTITLVYFLKSLKSGGIYVLEDLHSSIEVNDPHKTKIWGWGEPGFITPLEMLKHFNETGEIINDYLTEDEMNYLKENIKSVEIFELKPTSITSVIYKK